VVGPANCFATRYGRYRIRSPVPKRCSLASASQRPNCTACAPAEGSGTSWGQAVPWWPEEPIVDPEVFCRQPAGPL
jgi:hypothetical protein